MSKVDISTDGLAVVDKTWCSLPVKSSHIYWWFSSLWLLVVSDQVIYYGPFVLAHHPSLIGYLQMVYLSMFTDKVIYWCSLSRLFTDSLSVHVHHLSLIGLLTDGLSVHHQSVIILSTSGYRYVNDHVVYSWPTHQRSHNLLMSMCQQSCYLLIIYMSTITLPISWWSTCQQSHYLVMVYMSTITLSSDGLHVNSHAI